MQINDVTQHHRKIEATISESEIFELLAKHVAQAHGVEIDKSVKQHVFISQKDRTGTAGFEYAAKVELTVDLLPCEAEPAVGPDGKS